MNGAERTNYPIPPDPDFGYCQVEYQSPTSGQWTTCGEYADEEVSDTLMCDEHMDEHNRSEEADNARKGMKENT